MGLWLVLFGILLVSMKYIGVIDGNNFFVSCERLFRPDLVGVPVVVLSSNDGCVVARSQEVKDMGIQMGVPVFQIKDIIKDRGIITFSSNFTLYRDISARVFSVVKELLPDKEQYSIDEAFFTLEADSVTAAISTLKTIKQELEQRVGIPVSIGLAATKTQAKYASKVAKKSGGIAVLDAAAWMDLAPDIPLQDIWGVGGALQRRYRAAQLLTVADVINCPLERLSTIFGVVGSRLKAELSGRVAYPVMISTKPAQSITSSRTFKDKTTSKATVQDAVAYHVRNVVSDLVDHQQKAGQLSVLVTASRHGDYFMRGGVKSIQFNEPTNDLLTLMTAALRLVDELCEAGVPFNKAGVTLGALSSIHASQPSLFATVSVANAAIAIPRAKSALSSSAAGALSSKSDLVVAEQNIPGSLAMDCFTLGKEEVNEVAIDTVTSMVMGLNKRFGIETVQIGKHTATKSWQSKHEHISPAYTTQWSALAVVKA
jgi:DNA polymerase V